MLTTYEADMLANALRFGTRQQNRDHVKRILAELNRRNVAEAYYPELRDAARAARRFLTDSRSA
jgi:hypothetical protein